MDAEALEKLLSSLVRLLHLLNTEGALALDQPAEHQPVLVGDALHVLFLRPGIQTGDFPRRLRQGCLHGRLVIVLHDFAHVIKKFSIVCFNFDMPHVGDLVFT